MAMLLLDLVLAGSQLHCKQCLLLDYSSKDEGWKCCMLYVGSHKIPSHSVAMRPCVIQKGKRVMQVLLGSHL